MQFLGFGSGIDGDLVISSNTTDAPIDATCTGTINTNSLSANNASFAQGQLILIQQTYGSGAGNWELNRIQSYSGGVITTQLPLSNTYVAGAQVLVVKEYRSATVQAGVTLTAKAWNGSVGGIITWACSGKTTIAGTIDCAGGTATDTNGVTRGGFRGGNGNWNQQPSEYGDGTSALKAASGNGNANGNGGGGAKANGGANNGGGGGGGSNATAGGTATLAGAGGAYYGNGGVAGYGSVDLTNMVFGGGGGGGADGNGSYQSGHDFGGGSGGGIVAIFSKTLAITGSITVNGGMSGGAYRAGGSGAGGSILAKSLDASIGTNLCTALGGASAGTDCNGGAGGNGRIRVEACQLTGSTTQGSVSTVIGGQNWCGSGTVTM